MKYMVAAVVLILLTFLVACQRVPERQEPVQQGIVGQDTLPQSVEIVTDQHTKCQYLHSNSGGITPRLGRGGRPICETTNVQ